MLSGVALIDAGEAMRELGEVKDALDMEVKQNFIDPLQNLHDKDLKEIQVSKPNKAVIPWVPSKNVSLVLDVLYEEKWNQ